MYKGLCGARHHYCAGSLWCPTSPRRQCRPADYAETNDQIITSSKKRWDRNYLEFQWGGGMIEIPNLSAKKCHSKRGVSYFLTVSRHFFCMKV